MIKVPRVMDAEAISVSDTSVCPRRTEESSSENLAEALGLNFISNTLALTQYGNSGRSILAIIDSAQSNGHLGIDCPQQRSMQYRAYRVRIIRGGKWTGTRIEFDS